MLQWLPRGAPLCAGKKKRCRRRRRHSCFNAHTLAHTHDTHSHCRPVCACQWLLLLGALPFVVAFFHPCVCGCVQHTMRHLIYDKFFVQVFYISLPTFAGIAGLLSLFFLFLFIIRPPFALCSAQAICIRNSLSSCQNKHKISQRCSLTFISV